MRRPRDHARITAEETQGFFEKIWSWFTGLFNNNSDNNGPENNENSIEQVDSPVIEGSENTDSTIPVDDNSNTENTTNSIENSINSTEDTSSTEENIDSSQDQNNPIDSENINN